MKKVKTAELKANLSRYLREVRETGEEIQVCVREEPVAYLCALPKKSPAEARTAREVGEWRESFAKVGLGFDGENYRQGGGSTRLSEPASAPDGRTHIDSVAEMRREKDW